jgi:hypothetical protein
VDTFLSKPFKLDEKRPERLAWLVEQARSVDLEEIVDWLDARWG